MVCHLFNKYLIIADENIWKLVGRTQIAIQCIFWLISIYICDCTLIFECFEDSVVQFVILFVCVYHQICALRGFYYAIYTSSVVISKSKKDMKNQDILKTTECKKCGIIRPIRSHHCSVCEKCIDKLDHHCYFLNNCVGRKNYKFFFSYLFLSMINSIYMIILCFYKIILYKENEKERAQNKIIYLEIDFLLNFPIKVFILLFIAIPTFIGTVYLLIYHFFLMYKNQTTIERKYPKLYIEDSTKKKKSISEKLTAILESNNWLNIYWLE